MWHSQFFLWSACSIILSLVAFFFLVIFPFQGGKIRFKLGAELSGVDGVQFHHDFFFIFIYVLFSLLSLCYAHIHDCFIPLQFFWWFFLQPHFFYPLFCSYKYITFVIVGFPLQLLFGPIFLHTNIFKGNPIHQKAHRIVKYLKLKHRISQVGTYDESA